MNIKIQLLCFLMSFIYGIFIRILILFQSKINKTNNLLIHFFIDLLFVYIVALLYTLIIYKINKGVFHIYLIMLILIGYISSKRSVNFTISWLKNIKKKLIK